MGAAPPARCDPFVDSGILVPGLGDRTPPPIETPWRELHEHDLGDLDAAMRALDEELDEAGVDEDADRFDLEAIDVLLRGARIARELRIVLVG